MASFQGGSAPAMANQIVEGYLALNQNTLKGYTHGEIAAVRTELEKIQRGVRAETPAADDALAQQARSRKIMRLSSALQVLGASLTARR